MFAAGGSASSISSSGCSKKVENARLHPLPSPSASTAAPLSKVKRADFESDSAFYDALAILFTLVKVPSSIILQLMTTDSVVSCSMPALKHCHEYILLPQSRTHLGV